MTDFFGGVQNVELTLDEGYPLPKDEDVDLTAPGEDEDLGPASTFPSSSFELNSQNEVRGKRKPTRVDWRHGAPFPHVLALLVFGLWFWTLSTFENKKD